MDDFNHENFVNLIEGIALEFKLLGQKYPPKHMNFGLGNPTRERTILNSRLKMSLCVTQTNNVITKSNSHLQISLLDVLHTT